MKKLTVILLTLVLLLSLTACEEALSKLLYQRDGDEGPGAVQAQEPSIPNTAPSPEDTPPVQAAGPTEPAEPSEPDVSAPVPDETSAPEKENDKKQDDGIAASHSDVSLFYAGESFKLLPKNVTGVYACTYASADETIVTVDKEGKITAVAPGITTVTMHLECSEGQFDFQCIVRCRWTPEEPDLPGSETASGETEPVSGEAAQPSAPSLSGFFATLQGKYDGLSGMMVLDSQLLANYYPGLTGIASVEEVLIEESAISINNKAVGLVRLSDSATSEDILAVQNILQSRINAQAGGGAFYPDACEVWSGGVITSVSNCVGMFVYPDDAHSMATLFTDTFGG